MSEEHKKVIVDELSILSMRRVAFLFFVVVIGLFAEYVTNQHNKMLDREAQELKATMEFEVEQSFRTKARFDLKQGSACIDRIMHSRIREDASFDDRLFHAVDICMRKERMTNTGDAFMIDLQTLEFKYDPSLDCFVEGGKRYLGKEASKEMYKRIAQGEALMTPECALHANTEQCYKAQEFIVSGYSSRRGDNVWFNYDGAPEWIEYVVLPEEYVGYNGVERGHPEVQPKQYVLAIGTQSDEVWKQFEQSINKFDTFISKASDIIMVQWSIRMLVLASILYALFIGHADNRAFIRIKEKYKED